LVHLPSQHPTVPWPTDAWVVAPERSQLNPAMFGDLLSVAFDDDEGPVGRTNAFLVAHHGRIVFERYHPEVSATDLFPSWSMAKSVLHALFGTLVRDGLVDLDEPAGIVGWTDDRASITIRDLFEMRSGLEWNEDYVDEGVSHVIEMLFGDGRTDSAGYAASFAPVAPPGEVFNYSSGTSNILSAIAARVLGVTDEASFREELQSRVLHPLGMTSAVPGFDKAGRWVASSFLDATARDFLRFGLLYLRNGVWENRAMLPEQWADGARTPHSFDEESGQGYGLHWWTVPDRHGTFAANGYDGQRIQVVPNMDLVFVRLGKTPLDQSDALRAWYGDVMNALSPLAYDD
jgi:CubicO group peptidase (beta-lactamase class C family)